MRTCGSTISTFAVLLLMSGVTSSWVLPEPRGRCELTQEEILEMYDRLREAKERMADPEYMFEQMMPLLQESDRSADPGILFPGLEFLSAATDTQCLRYLLRLSLGKDPTLREASLGILAGISNSIALMSTVPVDAHVRLSQRPSRLADLIDYREVAEEWLDTDSQSEMRAIRVIVGQQGKWPFEMAIVGRLMESMSVPCSVSLSCPDPGEWAGSVTESFVVPDMDANNLRFDVLFGTIPMIPLELRKMLILHHVVRLRDLLTSNTIAEEERLVYLDAVIELAKNNYGWQGILSQVEKESLKTFLDSCPYEILKNALLEHIK